MYFQVSNYPDFGRCSDIVDKYKVVFQCSWRLEVSNIRYLVAYIMMLLMLWIYIKELGNRESRDMVPPIEGVAGDGTIYGWSDACTDIIANEWSPTLAIRSKFQRYEKVYIKIPSTTTTSTYTYDGLILDHVLLFIGSRNSTNKTIESISNRQ